MKYKCAIEMLENIIERTKPEIPRPYACLFSGGIDSATAHWYYGGDRFNVTWAGYETADDYYCNRHITISMQDIYTEMNNIFKCFDRPVCETGIFPLYFAYKYLSEKGYKAIVTGDGGDELFLGYKWDKLAMFDDSVKYHEIINHLYGKHVYIAKSLAKKFNIEIVSPFLHPEVIKFVLSLPTKYKVNLFRNKIILYDLMKGKVKLRPKYYFHNPIQKWFYIDRKEKEKWFLNQWLLTQTTSGQTTKQIER